MLPPVNKQPPVVIRSVKRSHIFNNTVTVIALSVLVGFVSFYHLSSSSALITSLLGFMVTNAFFYNTPNSEKPRAKILVPQAIRFETPPDGSCHSPSSPAGRSRSDSDDKIRPPGVVHPPSLLQKMYDLSRAAGIGAYESSEEEEDKVPEGKRAGACTPDSLSEDDGAGTGAAFSGTSAPVRKEGEGAYESSEEEEDRVPEGIRDGAYTSDSLSEDDGAGTGAAFFPVRNKTPCVNEPLPGERSQSSIDLETIALVGNQGDGVFALSSPLPREEERRSKSSGAPVIKEGAGVYGERRPLSSGGVKTRTKHKSWG
jgi:hypothetical protein